MTAEPNGFEVLFLILFVLYFLVYPSVKRIQSSWPSRPPPNPKAEDT